jgi:hypothetical protein
MRAAAATIVQPRTFPLPFTAKSQLRMISRKRNICVFDPRKDAHFRTVFNLLGNLVDIHWFDDFSAESLEKGELSENEDISSMDKLNPAMFIVELELLAHPNWRNGVKLMENFRRSQQFNTGMVLTVISNAHAILAAQKDCERLAVDWFFCWDSFFGPNSPATKQNLVHIVRGLL